MVFAFSDIYKGFGNSISTNEQTVPDVEENEKYNNDVKATSDGNKVFINKRMTWGALLLLVGAMVLIGILNRLGVE